MSERINYPAAPMVTITPEDIHPGYVYPEGFPRNPSNDPGYRSLTPDEQRKAQDENQSKLVSYMRARAFEGFSNLMPKGYSNAATMPVRAKEWADAIVEHGPHSPISPLVLMGPVGTGKTFSACAAARYLSSCIYGIAPGKPVFLREATDILADMKDYSEGSNRAEALQEAERAAVLILDDLARTKVTETDVESLTRILGSRIRSNRPVIVTTNIASVAKLESILGEHLSSRLLGGATTVLMGGPDRRMM